MSIAFRLLLILGAAAALIFVVVKVRKGHLKTADSVFWVIFAAVLVLIAIVPQLIYWLADVFGIQSPANLVFFLLLIVLIIREFMMTMRVARLRSQVVTLTQEAAIGAYKAARGRTESGQDVPSRSVENQPRAQSEEGDRQ